MRRKLKNFFLKLYDLCKNNEFCRFVLTACVSFFYIVGIPLVMLAFDEVVFSANKLPLRTYIIFYFMFFLYIAHFFWLPQDITNHFKKIAEYFDEDSEDEE